ncbi:hypothetical protein SO802_010006 [Lithocarpus litseifolius]|uniref:Uncharacterized protein n=1 Tax=Lithocarpus litseifolius TaxID=425828 RepID=A0AAW2DE56_9ROSI
MQLRKSTQELKKKLMEEERERKSAAAALDSAEKQAEGQRVLLRNAEDQLAASKTQITTLKKGLEEAELARAKSEKARDQAEQEGYDIGVVETKEALRAEVSGVCKTYCAQVWNGALNQAGVETSSILRKAKGAYCPPAIQECSPSGLRSVNTPEVVEVGKDSTAIAPTSSDKVSEVIEEEKNDQAMVLAAPELPITAHDPQVKREFQQSMEIVLASLPLPSKADPIGKGPKISETAPTEPHQAPSKEKIVIKKK